MDDNATCHRTLAVQDCLDSEDIQCLVWPARSPDLNPIENMWDALGRQVAGRNYPPTNKNTLIRALTEEWDKVPQQLLDNVVQRLDGVNFEFKKRDEPSRIKIFLLNEKDPKICEYVSGSYYENMTFVSLSENFNFEGYEHPHPCISLNRMIKRKMALSELEIFIGLLMLVPIVIFLVIGLLKCIGIIKKVQKTDGELSCELSGDLENALAIRDVEYPRCLDNPEQRVFDDMLRCRP
ncbi:transposable element Tc1 transposase [Trichonephila clavipes]|uniref:Transposable element Tc1 transposase n=1 Tax=Trichonephila clavipes TaxID=2585209 RepID=A0A8X6SQH4_TRICX|nr:transposable element Tc1 transposase [Trichonephila clavipes]